MYTCTRNSYALTHFNSLFQTPDQAVPSVPLRCERFDLCSAASGLSTLFGSGFMRQTDCSRALPQPGCGETELMICVWPVRLSGRVRAFPQASTKRTDSCVACIKKELQANMEGNGNGRPSKVSSDCRQTWLHSSRLERSQPAFEHMVASNAAPILCLLPCLMVLFLNPHRSYRA